MVATRVGSTKPICFSPIHSDRQSAAENEAGSSVRSMFDHTTVESTAVVPLVLEMSINSDEDMLTDPDQNSHSLVLRSLIQLVAWRVSGILSKPKEFQRRLQSFSPHG